MAFDCSVRLKSFFTVFVKAERTEGGSRALIRHTIHVKDAHLGSERMIIVPKFLQDAPLCVYTGFGRKKSDFCR